MSRQINIPWRPQPRQLTFLEACGMAHPFTGGDPKPAAADVIGYGGAAGGGKSDSLIMVGIIGCLTYAGLGVAYFRRQGVELEGLGGAIMRARELVGEWCKWNGRLARLTFPNGSILQFNHCNEETDVTKYQSSQFDILIFDEATHFTRFIYRYMRSRNRVSLSNCPPSFRAFTAMGTNPGNVGHAWFRDEFVSPGPPEEVHEVEVEEGRFERHLFIPAFLSDNKALLKKDPGYKDRLDSLPELERRQLLHGDWDAFGGQYFKEFDRQLHVIKQQDWPLEPWFKRFRSLDYGLDTTACYWWAVTGDGKCIVYRELHIPDLRLSEAAEAIMDLSPRDEKISYTVASPDLWNRRQDTGKSGQEVMSAAGLKGLIRADNRRVEGWRMLREYLAPYEDEQGVKTARLRFYDHCIEAIRCLPLLQHDKRNPEDASDTPHHITHAPESLRYGVMSRPPMRSISPKERMVRKRRYLASRVPMNPMTGY